MRYIKILELLIYSKQRELALSLPDLYSLVFHRLVRYKHNSFLCLSEQSLINFTKIEGLSDELKEKAQIWLSVFRMYLCDTHVKKEKKRQKRELLKMKVFFKQLKSKQGV